MNKILLTKEVDKALNSVCDAALKHAGMGALVAVQTLQQEIRDEAEAS